jgi:hypothetical protein
MANLLKQFFFYIGGILMIAFLYQEQVLLTILVSLFCLIQLTAFRQENDLYYFVVGFVLGPIVDIIAVFAGAWDYNYHTYLDIPLWLAPALGMMAVLLKRIAEALIRLRT